MTPNEASKRAKVSRPTIVKLIKNGEIGAIRDNRGHWKIDVDSFENWLKNHSETFTEITVKTDESTLLEVEIAILKERLQGKDELIEQLRADLERAQLPFWKRLF